MNWLNKKATLSCIHFQRSRWPNSINRGFAFLVCVFVVLSETVSCWFLLSLEETKFSWSANLDLTWSPKVGRQSKFISNRHHTALPRRQTFSSTKTSLSLSFSEIQPSIMSVFAWNSSSARNLNLQHTFSILVTSNSSSSSSIVDFAIFFSIRTENWF